MYIDYFPDFSNIYFSVKIRYFVYPYKILSGSLWHSRFLKSCSIFFFGEGSSKTILYLFNILLIWSVVFLIYRRMKKILLPVSSCDGCVLEFVVLLVCLLILLFISFLSYPFFCKAFVRSKMVELSVFFVRETAKAYVPVNW